MQQREYQKAITTWQSLVDRRVAMGKGEGRGVEVLRQQIKSVKTRLAQQEHMEKAAFGVSVDVEIADELKNRVPANARVFVIVKGDDGMPAPVAVKPMSVSELPAQIELTDANAMMPGRLMSQMKTLTFQARVSLSGQASASSGDIESSIIRWKSGDSQPVKLLINQLIP